MGPQQLVRIHTYIFNRAIDDLPDWAKCLAWYLRFYPAEYFCDCGDFGMAELVSTASGTLWPRPLAVRDVYEQRDWPFDLMYDGRGRTLMRRIVERLQLVRNVGQHQCMASWGDVGGRYADLTGEGWGPWGRRCRT